MEEMDQEIPAAADPAPGLVLTQATVHAVPQQLSDLSDGSSSSGDFSSSSDEGDTMDPWSMLDYRKAFRVGDEAPGRLPPVHPTNLKPTAEEFEILTAFCSNRLKLPGVERETLQAVSGFGEAARRAAKETKISSLPLHPGLDKVIEDAWREPHKAGNSIPALSKAPSIQQLAKLVAGGTPRVEDAFADLVQAGSADWVKRKGPDGELLTIPINDPCKEELRDGISKMVQLLAQQASTTSILAMVVDTLLTETYTCLFDTQEGLDTEAHERHYLALLFTLKSLSSLTEAAATGIGHGISLTRRIWLRHAEALGVQLPDRAKQVLKESPVSLDGLLGPAWADTVERQGRLVEDRETVSCLNRGARPSVSGSTGAPPAKKKGFGVKLNTPRKKKAGKKSGARRRRDKNSAKGASTAQSAGQQTAASNSNYQPAAQAPQGVQGAAGGYSAGRGRGGGRGRGRGRHLKQD